MTHRSQLFLGIDVGSVSTNVVAITEDGQVVDKIYLRTKGQPIRAVQTGLAEMSRKLSTESIRGVGTTGSGRKLAAVIVGADIVKNEITAHAVAASWLVPNVRTVIEIGGQDSKIILLEDGVIRDFAMNTVCAAGTGSFLDQQAARLGIPIADFGSLAIKARVPVRIAGRCTVFAESDMIHKQQAGYALPDIVAGLCDAMVRNYLNNVAKGKELRPTIVFQGGVAANIGMRKAFERTLQQEVIVPPHFDVMGAIGAALLARDEVLSSGQPTKFRGFEIAQVEYAVNTFECHDCANACEIVVIEMDGAPVATWGSKCGKWEREDGSRVVAAATTS